MFPDHPANNLIHHNIMCDNKHDPATPQHLYVRQPYALQIIQLVECTSPPPPAKYSPSMVPSSSYMSDSDQSSSYESSDATPGDDDDDDEPYSSYCSSLDAEACLPDLSYPHDPTIDDTYRVRMRRIRAWRDATLATDATSGTYARAPSITHRSFARRRSLPRIPQAQSTHFPLHRDRS
ncbi:hypothetical protein EWM64_g9241 [Hericium alpestre]|uniref:Uncharacterized protein n=1 Tax=Hericium alpestre TaxID=135208 RepID=A0A4Y9ZLE9_9AGAM|nr:hypothetical protein EWM64_g9241 [Hericium alpestre]